MLDLVTLNEQLRLSNQEAQDELAKAYDLSIEEQSIPSVPPVPVRRDTMMVRFGSICLDAVGNVIGSRPQKK